MVEGSELDIINLKFLRICFEAMSRLKINFNKSAVVVLIYLEEDRRWIADNLYYRISTLPITYLEMPLSRSCLHTMILIQQWVTSP